MLTPKEALAKDGKIPVKLGRGRMPAGGDERCRELAAMGWQIKGYAVSADKSATGTAPVVVKRAPINAEKIVQDYTIVYDEKSYKALGTDKKEWGMREVCNNCRVSLVQNHCDNPTILGDIQVSIVPR